MKQLIIIIILFLTVNILFAQNNYFISNINSSSDVVVNTNDMSFINLNTGYITANKFDNNTNHYYLYKTTNGGINFSKIWSNNYSDRKKLSVSFSNENTGYISRGAEIFKTTNGGIDFSSLPNIPNYNQWCTTNFLCAKPNGDFYLLQAGDNKIYKYSIAANNIQVIYTCGNYICLSYIELSKLNINVLYAGGFKYQPDNKEFPVLLKSEDNGNTWNFILDGQSDPYDMKSIENFSVVNDGIRDIIKLSCTEELYEYKNNSFNLLRDNWNYGNKVSFGDPLTGYYLQLDHGEVDNPPEGDIYAAAYRTTDGGYTWSTDMQITQILSLNTLNKFYVNGDVAYLTISGNTPIKFCSRKVNMNYKSFVDGTESSIGFYINNILINTPLNSEIRANYFNISANSIINTGQNNERKFYNWSNNLTQNIINGYPFVYSGIFGPNYKTKMISNTIKAISSIPTSVSTPSSTKAMRDTNAVVHQIHESLGGIFYSRSSDGGTNFISEETVNYSTLKNDADANKNSSLNIIRDDSQNDGSNPLTSVDAENSVVACWERYNAATQRTEIMVSKRVDNTPHTGHEWHRFNNTGNNNEPVEVFHSFPSNTDFQSYPKVFSVATRNSSGDINPLENFVTLVVHLEPFPNANSSTKRLIVTGKTDNQYCEYVIDEGNISDISVTAPINHYKFFSMHFAYIKDNEVQYKLVTLGADILRGCVKIKKIIQNISIY